MTVSISYTYNQLLVNHYNTNSNKVKMLLVFAVLIRLQFEICKWDLQVD